MFLDGLYAPVPGVSVRRRGSFRPVALRPFGRFVSGVAAELQNVPQREPDVLQQLPRRVWKSFRYAPAQLGREVANCSPKIGMRLVPIYYLRKLLTEDFIVAHGNPSPYRVSDVRCGCQAEGC